jgi:hypothetical protein
MTSPCTTHVQLSPCQAQPMPSLSEYSRVQISPAHTHSSQVPALLVSSSEHAQRSSRAEMSIPSPPHGQPTICKAHPMCRLAQPTMRIHAQSRLCPAHANHKQCLSYPIPMPAHPQIFPCRDHLLLSTIHVLPINAQTSPCTAHVQPSHALPKRCPAYDQLIT